MKKNSITFLLNENKKPVLLGSIWCQRLNAMIGVTGKHVHADPVPLTSSEDNTGALLE